MIHLLPEGGRLPGPVEVVGYLTQREWRRVHMDNGRSSVWTNADGTREVLVPLRPEGWDYRTLILEAVDIVAQDEQRAFLSVIDDIRTASADVVRLRRTGNADVLPLELGANFFGSAASIMLAAACAAHEPRASYGPRKPSDVIDFTRRAGFERTEPGSFVIKIVCPLSPRVNDMVQGTIPGLGIEPAQHHVPFARRATEMLVQALEKTREAAVNAIAERSMDPFVRMVPYGVSANLCGALGELAGGDGVHEIEFSVAWARTWPRKPGGDHISFHGDMLGIVSQAAERLADVNPLEDCDVIGPVVALKRGAIEREVTISTFVNSRPRKVLVVLNENDYGQAIRAHQQLDSGVVVQCTGDLVKDGRQYRLERPRNFAILSPE